MTQAMPHITEHWVHIGTDLEKQMSVSDFFFFLEMTDKKFGELTLKVEPTSLPFSLVLGWSLASCGLGFVRPLGFLN